MYELKKQVRISGTDKENNSGKNQTTRHRNQATSIEPNMIEIKTWNPPPKPGATMNTKYCIYGARHWSPPQPPHFSLPKPPRLTWLFSRPFFFFVFFENSAMKNCLHYKSLRGGAAAAPGLCNEGKKDHDVRARAPQTFRTRLRILAHTLRTARQQVRSVGRDLRRFTDRTEGFSSDAKSGRQRFQAMFHKSHGCSDRPQSPPSHRFDNFSRKLILPDYQT